MSSPGASTLHGVADTNSECMDDLAAAAAVLAMEVDSDAEDDMEQEVDAGEHGGDLLESGAEQLRTANKENDTGLPDSRAFGAAHKQVFPDPSNLRLTPSDLSDIHCHYPVGQPSDAPVRRWQWLHFSFSPKRCSLRVAGAPRRLLKTIYGPRSSTRCW